jgi:hypothetical protein
VEAFLRHRLETPHARSGKPIKPATVSVEYRALQQFFNWMLREEEIDRNPMVGAEAPIVPEEPTPVLEVGQLRALLDGGKGAWDRWPPHQPARAAAPNGPPRSLHSSVNCRPTSSSAVSTTSSAQPCCGASMWAIMSRSVALAAVRGIG